jgi:hypothetical protein
MSEYNSKLTIGVDILINFAFSGSDLDARQCFFNELDADDDLFEGMCKSLELKPTDAYDCLCILEQVVTDVNILGSGYEQDDNSESVIIPVTVTIDDELLKELNQDEALLRKYAREGSMIAVTVSEEADLHTEKTVYSYNDKRHQTYYMEKWLEDAMGDKIHPIVAEVSRDSIVKDLSEFKSKMGKDDKMKIFDEKIKQAMKKDKGDIER